MVSSLYRRKTFQDLPSTWPRRKVRPVGSTPRYFLVGQTPIFDVLPTYLVVSSHLQTGYETNICKKQVLSLLVKNQLNVFLVLLKFHHFFIHFFFYFFQIGELQFPSNFITNLEPSKLPRWWARSWWPWPIGQRPVGKPFGHPMAKWWHPNSWLVYFMKITGW